MKKLAVLLAIGAALFCAGYAIAEDLTPQLCKDKVAAVAALMTAEGEVAFSKAKEKVDPFVFADGKGYVWVQTIDANMIAHPVKPEMEGKSLMDMRDANGMYIFVAFGEMADKQGSGWVPYVWPKPGATESTPKISYVQKVEHGGKVYILGSGINDITADDIKKQFPSDKIYEE